MKRSLTAVALSLLIFPVLLPAQKTRPNQRAPKGVTVRGNRATAKSGYEFVRNSPNEVGLQRKKKKPPDEPKTPGGQDATFRCSCSSGGGTCTVSSNGQSIFCSNGSCTSCSLEITLSPVKAISGN